MLAVCIGGLRKASGGEGSAGCLVHVDVALHCGWLQCIVATEHSRYSLSCMQKL